MSDVTITHKIAEKIGFQNKRGTNNKNDIFKNPKSEER